MTNLETKIMNELKRRFNGEHHVILTMKRSGDKVFIEKQNDQDESYFFHVQSDVQDGTVPMNATSRFFTGFESLAGYLASYDEKIEGIRNDIKALDKYRENRIEGHTKEELKLGNDLFFKILGLGIPIEDVFDFANTSNAGKLYQEMGCTKEKGLTGLRLSDDWQIYSDWYKDIWGIRPNL